MGILKVKASDQMFVSASDAAASTAVTPFASSVVTFVGSTAISTAAGGCGNAGCTPGAVYSGNTPPAGAKDLSLSNSTGTTNDSSTSAPFSRRTSGYFLGFTLNGTTTQPSYTKGVLPSLTAAGYSSLV